MPEYDANTEIRGEKIVLIARRLSKPTVVNESGRHKANSITGTDNARAWIERARTFVRDRAQE